MTKNNKRRTVFLGVLALTVICFIFFNSAKTGEESSASSGFVVDIAKKLLGIFGISPQDEGLSFFIRKAAHFSEYFLLSLISALFFVSALSNKRYIAFAPVVAFSVAVCDEFIVQATTAGRSPEWRDVGIDTAGAVCAALAVAVWFALKKNGQKEKTK